MTRVVITALADADIEGILAWLADKAGNTAASRYAASFERLFERLAIHPAAGAPRPVLGARPGLHDGLVRPARQERRIEVREGDLLREIVRELRERSAIVAPHEPALAAFRLEHRRGRTVHLPGKSPVFARPGEPDLDAALLHDPDRRNSERARASL